MSSGVIYIVTGKKSLEEASKSAATLKSKMPNISITLFADEKKQSNCFDNFVPITSYQYNNERQSAKVYYISRSPYNYTLYLDSDTYICDDISELFTLLERFDIAAAHAPQRWMPEYTASEVPDCFPEFNCGVLLFRKSSQVDSFFTNWLALYERDLKRGIKPKYLPDQPTFREALYNSNLRVATLTPEYNCRYHIPGFVNKNVKILHGDDPDMSAVARTINAKTSPRVHTMGKWGNVRIFGSLRKLQNRKRIYQIRKSFQERGYWGAFLLAMQKLFMSR